MLELQIPLLSSCTHLYLGTYISHSKFPKLKENSLKRNCEFSKEENTTASFKQIIPQSKRVKYQTYCQMLVE
jgi:hypothetical protein